MNNRQSHVKAMIRVVECACMLGRRPDAIDCPLHAAAREMRDLLIDMLRPEDMHTDAEALIERWETLARALLAKIEGTK